MFDQQKSVRQLEEQVKRVLAERFPSERGVGPADNRTVYTMDVKDVSFIHPDTSYAKQAEMFNEDGTFESVVKGTVVVTKAGKPLHTFKNITLGVVPYPTDRGSYIINGNEKVFLHQMLRRPGIYALPTKYRSGEKTSEEVIGEIRTKRGNYQLMVDKKDGTLKATQLRFEYNIKGKGTVDGISFLHLLGATDAEIQKACGDDEIGKEIYATFKAKSKPMSVQDIHEKTHQRPFESDEATIQRITTLLGDQKFDAHSQRINEISTGVKVDHVGKEAFLAALKAMVAEIHPDKQNPSLDDPRYKTVLTPEAVIARSVDKGIGEWLQSVSKKLVGVRYTNDATQEKNAFRPTDAISKEVRKTYSSSLSEAIDGGNPLDLHQKLRKVTSLGDFGLTRQSVVNSNRNLLPGMFGKIDPVETPQSGSMGVVEYLARDAEIKDGLIHSKFYRVKNRIADASKTIDDIDPLDEDKEYIAFNDPTTYKVSGKRWELKDGKVRARHDNQFVEVDSKLITLIDRTPTSHLSYAVSAIPFAQNNDGPRLLMGASMQKQALPIIGAEAPLVQALAGTDERTADRELADNISQNLRSPVNGKVTKVTEKQIVITDVEGQEHKLERLNYFSTGKNSGFINHKVVVSVGDTVKKGDLLADGWHSKNGEFALGRNVMVAFMPFKGLNFEDSVVISQSTANELASEEVKVLIVDIGADQIAYGQPFTSGNTSYTVERLLQKEAKVTKEQAAKLDARGIIKKGQSFHAGDVLVARYKNSDDIAETELRLRKRSKEGRFLFNPYRATGYQKGKVIDVHVKKLDEGHRVTIRFLAFKPMVKGDKLSGRHGNKGTISQVIPDAEMPYIAGTKEHVGLIFSPLAVPSRNNPGQLFEVNAGMLAKKKGLDKYVVRSFDKRERQRLYDAMEKEGMANGEYQLIDPDTGKAYENKTTVGPMYIMKLKHKTEMKLTRRATDINGRTIDYMTNMPKKISGSIDGERMGPQAIGGMEFWSLTSAGAVHNIHEMTTIKSDGIERERGRLDLYNAIASGKPLPSPVTPTTLKNLQDYLYAAGIRMNPMNGDKETTLDDHFTSLMLSPNKAKDAAFDGLPEVYSSKLDRATFHIDPKELKRAKGKDDEKEGRGRKLEQNVRGGLYDEEIFGADKEKWGKITLSTPIANPIFLKDNNAYAALLYDKNISGRDLKRLAKGEAYYVFDPKGVPGVSPGDVLSGKDVDDLVLDHEKLFDVATGGAALERLLKGTDLSKTLEHIREDIKTERKVEERSKLVNLARIVSHAVDKGYEPTDYLLKTVPVLPYKYRPKIEGKDSVSHDDLTQLYQKVIEENLSYGKRYAGWVREQGKHDINRDENKQAIVKQDAIPQFVVHEAQSDSARALYKRVEDLVGTKSPKDSGIQNGTRKTEDDLRGILDRLASKKGFLRDKMQKKNQDYSARSVIVSDPNLNIDEVALPEDIVKVTFEPQILNELRKLGIENRPEARKHIAKGDAIYREAVKRVFKETPVVLNRAPSLHKHSTQGFVVSKIYWNGENDESKAIGLNPIVTTGFNADFDGDSLLNSVFVRYSDIDIKTSKSEHSGEGVDEMPMSGDSKIRYRYGLVNLKDFPRVNHLETKKNVDIYSVPKGTEVLTVWNNEKRWLPVESFSVHKDLEMLEVKTNTSRTLQVSNDHSLVTVDENLDYMRAPATKGMTLPRLRKPLQSTEYELLQEFPLPKVEEKRRKFQDNIKLDFDSGYFFGAYIGDGWISNGPSINNRHSIYMADSNGKVIEKVHSVISAYLIEGKVIVSSTESPHDFKGHDSFSVKRTWNSARFSQLLRDHIGSGAQNKKLPDFWIQSAESFRWGLLSGLIDTDGTVSTHTKKNQTHVSISTTSHALAYGVVGLAHSLDMNASVTLASTPTGNVCYVVFFSQESIKKMQSRVWLANEYKLETLKAFKLNKGGLRNKYTPKLNTERIFELRRAIGSPRLLKGMTEEELASTRRRKSLYSIVYRVEKADTAIAKQTAFEIFELIPEFFELEFWSKWKKLVEDDEIEWEMVTDIKPLPFITEAYDLTIPPAFTMVTESGIVVYDTMSMHVPLSAASKQEVFDRLMPSKNLINPTNGSMIAELKHEMSLGIYYSTRDRMPTGKNVTFKDFKALEAAYNKAEVATYQAVTMMVPGLGSVRSTAGKHLFNLALVDARVPRKFIDYKKNINMDAKKVRKLLEQINAEKQGGGPFVTSQAINNLRRIGFKTATTSGMSISLKDFDNITRIDKHRMLSDAKDDATFKKNLKKNDPALFKAVYEKPVPLHAKQVEAFEQAKSNFVHAALKDMVSPSGQNILGTDNPLGIMMSSGARGNPGQYVGMGAMLGVGKDVENKTTMPVTSSMIEGLNPEEFFIRSTDARKGIFDKSIATQDPGALTRQIWFANRQTVIESKDCGDKVGVTLNLATDSRHLRGRVLLESIKMPLGIIKADGNPIDYQEFERVQQAVKSNKLEQKTVRVRSPLTCKATHGICQKCYGARPDANNDELVPIGEAVGSIAAQALGEPSQQAIMRTFHSGAGQSTTTNAFEQIKNVLELSSTAKPNTAIVARKPGRITKIDTHPFTGSVVTVDTTPYKLGSLPVNPQLRVGVEVEACDSLTDPRVTHINPRDVLALQGEKAAQNYLIDTVTDAFKMGNIDDTDRRHLELTVGNMTNRAIVEDEGSTPFTMGQTVRKDALVLENAKMQGPSYQVSLLDSHKHKVVGKHAAREVKRMRGGGIVVKKGEVITEALWRAMKQDGRKYVMISDAVQATYTPQVSGVQNDTKMADNNWLGNAAFRNSKSHILRGAAIGSEDQLSDPLTRQMTGLKGNFGAGYNDWAKQMNEQYAGIF